MQRASHQLELVPPLRLRARAEPPPAGRRRGGVRGRRRCRHAAVRRRGLGLALSGDGLAALGPGVAALVLAGEQAQLEAFSARPPPRHGGLRRRPTCPARTAGDGSAPEAGSEAATGHGRSRSCSARTTAPRATLFAGYIPPGKAPWLSPLRRDRVGAAGLDASTSRTASRLPAGSAVRLRPRQVHIVENAGDTEMTIIGVFTPAGARRPRT